MTTQEIEKLNHLPMVKTHDMDKLPKDKSVEKTIVSYPQNSIKLKFIKDK